MTKIDHSEDQVSAPTRIVLSALLAYLLLFSGYAFVLWQVVRNSQERGLFGDAFGGFNAFISGLAFLGIIAALVLQQRQLNIQLAELRCQREELALQREELANQVGEMKATREQVELQRLALESAARAQSVIAYGQNLAKVFELLQNERVREARRVVFAADEAGAWGVDLEASAEIVCSTYNAAGRFVAYGLLPESYLVGWSASLRRIWPKLQPFVERRRKEWAFPELYEHFEHLAVRATSTFKDSRELDRTPNQRTHQF